LLEIPSMWLIIGAASAIAFYMAWSIGANDVSNSMATAVGARAITHKQAVIIAGVLVFLGAVLVGPHVSETIKSDIINVDSIPANLLLLGFISSLLAAAIWATLSTWKEMPISTTHSIIGALMGFGLIVGGIGCVNWVKIGHVAASWVLSPVFGCIVAFIIFKLIVRLIFSKEEPVSSAKIVGPVIIGATAFLILSSFLLKTPLSKDLDLSLISCLIICLVVSIVVGIIGIFLLRKVQAKKSRRLLYC
jgi:inorganic phosphate transporter, PiT family